MGASGSDLLLSPKAQEYFPFQIECKCQEKINIWQSWEQAKSHGDSPILFIKRNYTEPLAVLSVEQLLSLLETK